MTDKLDEYRERMGALEESGELSEGAKRLLDELINELTESSRSNRALRKAVLKTGQSSAMSTRLREALYE